MTFHTEVRPLMRALCAGGLLLGLSASAIAVPLESGFGGPANFGELALNRTDDGSSNLLNLPFEINFFGTTYNQFHVNNNGNVTFGGPVGAYTPNPFPASSNAMIAPYWGDVDTSCFTCGAVYVATPSSDTVVVTWNNVGYYSSHSNITNNFQLVLRDRSAGNSAGDFDITFRYDRLTWTTGDASGGSGGFGGTRAQAGFDAGDGINFFTLPGSRTDTVTQLAHTSNVAGGPGGLWTFAIRAGAVPGSTPDNPLMPVVSEVGWNFNFNVNLDQQVFIDPVIAVGYDYIVNSGASFQTVLLPEVGDNIYDLWLWNGSDWYDSGTDLMAGVLHDFGAGGVSRFSIRGIEVSAGLDPNDTLAFVTGLTFTATGNVDMNMIPITVDIAASVPEPSALLILLTGLAGLIAIRRVSLQGR